MNQQSEGSPSLLRDDDDEEPGGSCFVFRWQSFFFLTGVILEMKTMSGTSSSTSSGAAAQRTKLWRSRCVSAGRASKGRAGDDMSFSARPAVMERGLGSRRHTMESTASDSGSHCDRMAWTCTVTQNLVTIFVPRMVSTVVPYALTTDVFRSHGSCFFC